MEDTSCIVKASVTNDWTWLLKRKRARKLVELINAAKRHPRTCKRARTEDSKRHGTAYHSFDSNVYEWLAKFPVVDASNNMRSSGVPTRFMFYDKADWKHFSSDATAVLCEQFRTGKNSAELFIHGRTYLVSFVQMLQLNVRTGYLRSVAWTDEHGKSSFPSQFLEGHATQLSALLREPVDHQHRVKLDNEVTGSQICRTVDWIRACGFGARKGIDGCGRHPTWMEIDGFGARQCLAGGSPGSKMFEVGLETLSTGSLHPKVGEEASAVVGHDFTLLGDKLVKLVLGDEEYHVIVNKFLTGLGMLSNYTSVVGIYRDTHSSASGQARLQAFQKQEEITKKIRRDANIQHAWHGTSKQGISGIILHGFGQPKTPKNGTAYGVGVYLAPEHYSHISAVYSDVDENGEQHMVLCHVIMGNMEEVPLGSEQFHPSGEDFDTGVDDRLNPKRYIIWSTHMNTHILPQYVVSFKISPQWHDVMATLRGKQTTCNVFKVKDSMEALRGKLMNEVSLPVSTSAQAGTEECMHQKVGKMICSRLCKVDNTSNQVGPEHESTNRAPRSPWVSLPRLLYTLRLKLPPTDMIRLQQLYVEFKAGRMPREFLIRHIRAAAGDHILADSIRSMQTQVSDKT